MHSHLKHGRFDGWRTAQRQISSRQRTLNWAACHLSWGSEAVDIFRPTFVHTWVWAHGASASCRGKVLRSSLRMRRIEVWRIPASAARLVAKRRGFVHNFSLVFLTVRLVRTVLFLPWPGRLDVWPVSLNFLTTFQPFHAEFEAFLRWSNYSHTIYGGLRLFLGL